MIRLLTLAVMPPYSGREGSSNFKMVLEVMDAEGLKSGMIQSVEPGEELQVASRKLRNVADWLDNLAGGT